MHCGIESHVPPSDRCSRTRSARRSPIRSSRPTSSTSWWRSSSVCTLRRTTARARTPATTRPTERAPAPPRDHLSAQATDTEEQTAHYVWAVKGRCISLVRLDIQSFKLSFNERFSLLLFFVDVHPSLFSNFHCTVSLSQFHLTNNWAHIILVSTKCRFFSLDVSWVL